MKKILSISVIAIVSLLCASAIIKEEEPNINYVPDEKTAVMVAEAVWTGIWGEAKVDEQKPFTATLTDGVWYVRGTIKGTLGGTIDMHLQARDCKVLDVTMQK